MKDNFRRSLAFTLKFEGGYVNHPKDPGGATNKGITLTTYRRYRKGATVADLKAIPDSMVERIYRDGYWEKVRGDTLAPGVDGATFDYGVNSGPSAATKSLLAVVGTKPADTVKRLCARRLSIYQTFKHWKTFGKGWTRRITAGEALWVSWALAATAPAPSVKATIEQEAATASKTANQQRNGAGGAAVGSGGSVIGADRADVSGWTIGVLVVVGLLFAAFLIWRSRINKQRAEAYAEVAKGL